ncbi:MULTISPECIES: hypothetical protein [Xanthobacter]|jgi:hypothetical protein|uniref:hypothetical protein n=1 Tax=Xanthobacter TaxID=279 RepID=UPI0024A74A1A|nr:hypothetical protein [Xanthobacter autotrophicus]MDI4658256.1 hypothetical protein [Xanthobacter autotrophicus]MDI4665319.1 hypothetical protein [Xanthobacter autotrophicus]
MDRETPHDAVLRTEVALEILNQARAIVTSRIHDLEAEDPEAAEALRVRRRTLVELQHCLRVEDCEAVIATWGPWVRDESLFWREF